MKKPVVPIWGHKNNNHSISNVRNYDQLKRNSIYRMKETLTRNFDSGCITTQGFETLSRRIIPSNFD